VVTAFDVAADKVGRTLSEAILSDSNNTIRFQKLREKGPVVVRGPTLDGLSPRMKGIVKESPERPVDVSAVLRHDRVEVLANYLPVGSDRAAAHYAKACVEAGVAFVNCMPSLIASDPRWARRFELAGVPTIGDDVKSQLGATVLHRTLLELFKRRGVGVDRTFQVNYGGNADFINMLDQERLTTKRISKRAALTSVLGKPVQSRSVEAGPVGYVPWLEDRKVCDIRVEGSGFGGVPVRLDAKLEVWDSPNSAGVVVDALRCAKLALDRHESGSLEWPSSCFMKHPPRQHPEEEAEQGLDAWINEGSA
jgi:myo-inositol-1-phosphate synthase